MKRKTRTITINDRQYAWWYRLDGCTMMNFSPLHDKTAVITVEFPCNMEYAKYITIKKDYQEYRIKIVEPKMASLLLLSLSHDAFLSRKNITYNGYDLLAKTGYQICEVEAGILY